MAARCVDRLCRRWNQDGMESHVARVFDMVVGTLSPMIGVSAKRPSAERNWTALESMVDALGGLPRGASDQRIARARVELLAARGDLDRAYESLPPPTDDSTAPQIDALRISVVEKRDGLDAMRAAVAALPRWRFTRPVVLTAAARAEASRASGDDRQWLRSHAAASDELRDANRAVQVLQELAALARNAGWDDEVRAVWEKAASRLPNDFRPHLFLAIDAARRGDADTAAAAAARVVATEGRGSPRGRVASAAAIIAAVRSEMEGASPVDAGADDSHATRLQEAQALLLEAENDRRNWQPVAVLRAAVESLQGRPFAAARHLQRAVDLGPHDPLLVADLSAMLERCACRSDAERVDDTVAPVAVGGGDRLSIDAFIRVGDTRSAAERALAAIDADGVDLRTLLWLGRLCSRGGLHHEAAELATKATRSFPTSPDAWLRLVRCRQVESEAAAESALAEGCDAVSPEDRRLLEARGEAFLRRNSEAFASFLEAIEHGGDDVAPAGFLVDFLVEQSRPKEGEKFLQSVIDGRWGERSVLQKWAVARLGSLRGDGTEH